MTVYRVSIFVCVVWLIAATTALGQHVYTVEELAEGGRLYQSVCAGCHGQNGDAIAGANLMTGAFRSVNEDEDLIDLIRLGIPGTSMPSNDVSSEQAGTILAYLRSMAGRGSEVADTGTAGDATSGRNLFEVRGCMNCHRVNGEGGRRGPDLTRVARVARRGGRFFVPPTPEQIRQRIETSIVEPNLDVSPSNRTFRMVATGGTVTIGRLLNHDTHSVSVLVDGDRVETHQLVDLDELELVDSPMPSFRDSLSAKELADLVSYLTTLTGN